MKVGQQDVGVGDRAAAGRDLNQITDPLSRAMVGGAAPPSPGHAASLWLSDNGELLSATRTGQDWLERLRTPEMPARADAVLTGLAVQVAANMARSGPGRPPRPGSVRARGSLGESIILHGEPITGPDGRTQGIGVVIGPARPGIVLPVLAAAYGLTGREQEVVRAVFAKTGVSSRGERAHRFALQFT